MPGHAVATITRKRHALALQVSVVIPRMNRNRRYAHVTRLEGLPFAVVAFSRAAFERRAAGCGDSRCGTTGYRRLCRQLERHAAL
ncbi:hypothetical protein KCP77_22690 [Salmonella enterica subsp. enterica]|nr:hypothetical protein KCP77_22690 [Salmonella enterica subsp. enterica]